MSDKSPLFISSMELYAHSIELYATERQRNFKFTILHLANAVELLFKDALIDLGESIYKSPKETITIWGAFKLFEERGITIPEKPHLEILIDDRNTLQHRFGFPDDRATYYYIDIVSGFLQRFLKERYDLNFDEVIPEYLDKEYLSLIGLDTNGVKSKINALYKISPPSAAIEAFNDLEHKLGSIISSDIPHKKNEPIWPLWRRSDLTDIIEGIVADGYLPADSSKKINFIRMVRNQAAHGITEEEKENIWPQAIEYYFDLIDSIEKAIEDGYMYKGQEEDSSVENDEKA